MKETFMVLLNYILIFILRYLNSLKEAKKYYRRIYSSITDVYQEFVHT